MEGCGSSMGRRTAKAHQPHQQRATIKGREPLRETLPSAFASTDTYAYGLDAICMPLSQVTTTHLDKGIWDLAGEEIELVARCVRSSTTRLIDVARAGRETCGSKKAVGSRYFTALLGYEFASASGPHVQFAALYSL
jgi:hypothetical protein